MNAKQKSAKIFFKIHLVSDIALFEVDWDEACPNLMWMGWEVLSRAQEQTLHNGM